MTTKVLIVDDQALVRAGFRMLMDADANVEVVGEAADGLEAVTLARQVHPEVVLMDIRMPVMDGVEATRILTAPGAGSAPRVIILTTFDLDQYVYDALQAGCTGYRRHPAERQPQMMTVASTVIIRALWLPCAAPLGQRGRVGRALWCRYDRLRTTGRSPA